MSKSIRTNGNALSKTARLEARLTADQKAAIERAAAYQGRTVSDFVVHTLQEAAKAVIQEHEVWRLDASQSEALVKALLNPPEPNAALKSALRDYRKTVKSR